MSKTTDHIKKVDVMKEDFGWEIPVELVPIPSQGLIYNPESSLYHRESLKIKAMTAREEDILSSAALIKEGTVLDHLINSCLMDKINVNEMILGDRNALMIAIRITGYGPEYPVRAYCEKCSTENKVNVDLTNIPIKRLAINPVEEGKNLFSFKLPVTKKIIHFKYPTLMDDRDRAAKERSYKKALNTSFDTRVTGNLEAAIVKIDNISDKNKIKHFILNMPAYDSRSLRKFMADNEPGMDMKCSFTCTNCKHENTSNIPMTSEFFWPGT